MTDCRYPDSDRSGEDGDLAKVGVMIRSLDFHGVVMLAKPCPKCNRLHHWRIITTMPPSEGHVQDVLRYTADIMDEGTTAAFVIAQSPQ